VTYRMIGRRCGVASQVPGTVPLRTSTVRDAGFMLRWLRRAPEDFMTGPVVDVGDTRLPDPGPAHRLRWDLARLHSAVKDQRRGRHLS